MTNNVINFVEKKFLFWDYILYLLNFSIIMIIMVPQFYVMKYYSIVLIGLEVISMLVMYCSSPKIFIYSFKKNILFLGVLFYIIIISYLSGNYTIGNRYSIVFTSYFACFSFLFFNKTQKLDILKYSIISYLPFFIVTLIKTLNAALINPYLLRQINTTIGNIEFLRQGIGGYHFIYSVSLISIVFLELFLNSKRCKKFFSALLYFFCIITIIASNFFTAMTISILGSLIVVTLKIGKKNKLLILNLILASILLIIIIDPLVHRFWLSILDENGRIYKTLSNSNGFIDALFAEFMYDRWPTIKTSLESILQYPIFGLIINKKINLNKSGFIGQHSFFFDTLGLFGLMGLVLNFIIIFSYRKLTFIRARLDLFLPLMISFIMLLVFNNITESSFLINYWVFPLFIYYMNIKPEKQ